MILRTSFYGMNQNRPVGSGAAWRRSPHQKSAGREREKEEKGGKKEKRGEIKEREREREREGRERGGRERSRERESERERERERERGEKGKKGSGDQERNMYYAYMGVKHPLRTVKRLFNMIKDTKRGGLKKAIKSMKRGRGDRNGW